MSVSIKNLSVRYGTRTVVDDVSVSFARGAVGLLGRNGAGKSSVLKALLGLLIPAHGSISFVDLPPDASPETVRAHIGYMPEREAYLPQCSGFEMVAMLGMLSAMPRKDAYRRAHEVLYLVGLEEQRYRSVASYSAGMRQKAKLAAALVHDPQLLLLDEPTNGLDPDGRSDMLALVRQLSKDLGKSVVFSTHILQDVEAVCDSAVVMEQGRVVAHGTLRELTGGVAHQYGVLVDPANDAITQGLMEVGRVENLGNGRYTVWLADKVDVRAIFAAALRAGSVVRSLVQQRRSLEAVFLQVVGQASEARTGPAS